MNTFTAQPTSLGGGYDIPDDVRQVVEATRHLCDFRTGQAEILVHLAEEAVTLTHVAGMAVLEPALRILGAERATRFSGRLIRIAQDTAGDWYEGKPDWDQAARTLRYVADEAAHAIADEFHRDNRICCNATKEKHQ